MNSLRAIAKVKVFYLIQHPKYVFFKCTVGCNIYCVISSAAFTWPFLSVCSKSPVAVLSRWGKLSGYLKATPIIMPSVFTEVWKRTGWTTLANNCSQAFAITGNMQFYAEMSWNDQDREIGTTANMFSQYFMVLTNIWWLERHREKHHEQIS